VVPNSPEGLGLNGSWRQQSRLSPIGAGGNGGFVVRPFGHGRVAPRPGFGFGAIRLVELVRNDAQGAGSFDGARDGALVERAEAGAAATVDLHLGIHEFTQDLSVFVINDFVRRGAKKALPFDRCGAGEVAVGFADGRHRGEKLRKGENRNWQFRTGFDRA